MSEKTELLESLEELRRRGLLSPEEYALQSRAIRAEFPSEPVDPESKQQKEEVFPPPSTEDAGRTAGRPGIPLFLLTIGVVALFVWVGTWFWSISNLSLDSRIPMDEDSPLVPNLLPEESPDDADVLPIEDIEIAVPMADAVGPIPTPAMACEHYMAVYIHDPDKTEEELGESHQTCLRDVRGMRDTLEAGVWEGFVRCFVGATTALELNDCIDFWYFGDGVVDAVEEPVVPESENWTYDLEAFLTAEDWTHPEACWGEWCLVRQDDALEIFNRSRPDGIRTGLYSESNGWVAFRSRRDDFVLYPNLSTSSAPYHLASESNTEVLISNGSSYAYRDFLLQFEVDSFYVCHSMVFWCLEYPRYSSGWITLHGPVGRKTLSGETVAEDLAGGWD